MGSKPAPPPRVPRAAIEALVAGSDVKEALTVGGLAPDDQTVALFGELARTNQLLAEDHELPALMRALDGKFIEPGPAGAPSRGRSDVLPTGRNLFSVDPRAVPTPTVCTGTIPCLPCRRLRSVRWTRWRASM